MEGIWRIREECLTRKGAGEPPPQTPKGVGAREIKWHGNVKEGGGLNEREKCKRRRKNYGK